MMQKNSGRGLAGALGRNPRMQRVSPGVYRNAQGNLSTPRGGMPQQPMQQAPQQPMQRMPLPEQQMPQMADQMTKQPLPGSQDMGQAFGQLGRQPIPQNEMPQFAANMANQVAKQPTSMQSLGRPMPAQQFQQMPQMNEMMGQLQQNQGMQQQFQQMAQQYQQPQQMPQQMPQPGMPFRPLPYQRMR